MDPFQKLCQVETRKLFLVIGIITCIVIATQFLFPPYENFLSFLSPDDNASFIRKSSSLAGDSSNKSLMTHSVPPLNHSTNLPIVEGVVSNTEESELVEETRNEINGNDGDINGSIDPILTLPPVYFPINLSIPKELQNGPIMPSKAEKPGLLKSRPAKRSKKKKSGLLRSAPATSNKNSSMVRNRITKARIKLPPEVITSISEMNVLLSQSRASSHSTKPQWSSAPDEEILSAKLQIENAPMTNNDLELYAPVFRNMSMFKRSYELMEQILKVFVYTEGEKPIFHQPILDGIYASEGWFMKLMESNKQFVVNDPKKAHLFYLPFSTQVLRYTLYVPDSHNRKNLVRYLENYTSLIAAKYPFWNRTDGADHFLVACHDWAPTETNRAMGGCIRALCNADVNEAGFIMGKDVSLPETNIHSINNPLEYLGGKPPQKREILAFFAGRIHGYLRPILLKHWENKDPDIKIYGGPNSNVKVKNYIQYMRNSKYCICARGFEVNSPRVVEAIFYECVPVIISDNFVPPFFDVLDWEAFAVFVPEKDIPKLKNILLSIPQERYLEMQRRVRKVQQHFLWHAEPVKYDIFHMILHSVWYNRVSQIQP